MVLSLSPRNLNASVGVLGIFCLGIFLTWFSIAGLSIPLPAHPVDRSLVIALLQTLGTIVVPYLWAWTRLGRSPASLGLTHRNLGRSVLLGCGLYVFALAGFMYCSADPLIADHPVRHVGPGKLPVLAVAMCLIAAGTDIATRGFILLSLAEYTHVGFAVAMQNVFWLFGHTHEIRVLSHCMGLGVAVGLFLLLGILGDTVVLRTRNVVGLAAAHILLNLGMIFYIRQL